MENPLLSYFEVINNVSGFGPEGLRKEVTYISGGSSASPISWSDIQNKPNSLSGYGITLTEADLPQISWSKLKDVPDLLASVSWSDIQNKPNSLSGYGITLTEADLPQISWSKISNKPNSLSGYGITLEEADIPQISWSKIKDTPSFLTSVKWSDITDKPNTLLGYGITLVEENIPQISWSKIYSKPTTLAGYGLSITEADLPQISWSKIKDAPNFLTSVSWNDIANKPTTLSGYGITISVNDLPMIPWSKITDAPSIGSSGANISIKGKLYTYPFVPLELFITDYDVKRIYSVSAGVGSVQINGEVITYIPPVEITNDTITVSVDGETKAYPIEIRSVGVEKPSITYPTNGQTKLKLQFTLTSTPFVGQGDPQQHNRTQWQIATDVNFTSIVMDIDTTSSLTSLALATQLEQNSIYFARVRYNGSISGWSPWSDVVMFTTASNSVVTPSIVYPTQELLKVSIRPIIRSSAFDYEGSSQTHVSSSWQIATDEAFTNLIANVVDSTTSLTTYTHTTPLSYNTLYYVRVKHKGSLTGESNWSTPVKFTTSDINGFLLESKNASQNTKFIDAATIYDNGVPYVIVVGSEQTTMGGSNVTMFIMKTDTRGNVIWRKVFNPFTYYPNSIVGLSVVEEDGVPYIYAGAQLARTSTVTVKSAAILKIATDGNIVWSRILTRAENMNVADMVAVVNDNTTGVYLFSHIINRAGTYQGVCYDKLDRNGNYIKSFQWAVTSIYSQTSVWLNGALENGVEYIYSLSMRRSTSENYNGFNVTKLDKDLNVIWSKKVLSNPLSSNLTPYCFVTNEENGSMFYYVSYLSSATGQSTIAKFDSLFNVVWIRNVAYSSNSTAEYISGMAVHKNPVGDEIVLIGTDYSLSSSKMDTFMTKIKTDGTKSKNIIVSGSLNETPTCCTVVNTPEPTYIGLGSSGSIATNTNPSGIMLGINKDFNFISSTLANSTHLTLRSTNFYSDLLSNTVITIANETYTTITPTVSSAPGTTTLSNSTLTLSSSQF